MECDIIFGIYGEPRGGNRLENNAGLIRAPRAPRPGSCSLQSKHGDEEDHGRSGGERPHPTKSNPTNSSRSRRCTPGARADLLAADALAPGDARVARALRALG